MKKGISLSVRMWLGFFSFTFIFMLIISSIFTYFFSSARENEIFQSIIESQKILVNKNLNVSEGEGYSAFSVNHIGIVDKQVKLITFTNTAYKNISTQIIEKVSTSFSEQENENKKYKTKIGGYSLFYFISKEANNGVISFRIDDTDSFFNKTVGLLIPISLAIILLLSLIFSAIISKGMTSSIRKLEQSAEKLANGDLQTPVIITRNDEIGRLSVAIDEMRNKLSQKDLLRQSEIQYISHEMKTPIMTIMGYTEAIKDNIFPKGDLLSSLEVIDSQSKRLLNIVKKLLTLTRLEYIESKNESLEQTNFKNIIEEICISFADNKVKFELDLENVTAPANSEKIKVLCENLIENAVRYSKNIVKISLKKIETSAYLIVENDGECIDSEILPDIFEAYKKGKKGVSGLGLSIVKKIVDSYAYSIKAENTEFGARFIIKINNLTEE